MTAVASHPNVLLNLPRVCWSTALRSEPGQARNPDLPLSIRDLTQPGRTAPEPNQGKWRKEGDQGHIVGVQLPPHSRTVGKYSAARLTVTIGPNCRSWATCDQDDGARSLNRSGSSRLRGQSLES